MKSSARVAIFACLTIGAWGLSTVFWPVGEVEMATEAEIENEERASVAPPSQARRQPSSNQEPVPAAVPAAASVKPSSRVAGAHARLRGFQTCLQTQDCEYSHADPRSYDFALHREWRDFLRALRSEVGRDAATDREIAAIARESMLATDGHVQEAALSLMAGLPADSKNMEAVVRGLEVNDADPLILRQAGSELKRYLGSSDESRIHEFLEKTLRSGAHFTAEQAGIMVKEFLSHSSVQRYRQLLREIPNDSVKARNLRAALSDYDLRQTGG